VQPAGRRQRVKTPRATSDASIADSSIVSMTSSAGLTVALALGTQQNVCAWLHAGDALSAVERHLWLLRYELPENPSAVVGDPRHRRQTQECERFVGCQELRVGGELCRTSSHVACKKRTVSRHEASADGRFERQTTVERDSPQVLTTKT
jgi:hypothetical protein